MPLQENAFASDAKPPEFRGSLSLSTRQTPYEKQKNPSFSINLASVPEDENASSVMCPLQAPFYHLNKPNVNLRES